MMVLAMGKPSVPLLATTILSETILARMISRVTSKAAQTLSAPVPALSAQEKATRAILTTPTMTLPSPILTRLVQEAALGITPVTLLLDRTMSALTVAWERKHVNSGTLTSQEVTTQSAIAAVSATMHAICPFLMTLFIMAGMPKLVTTAAMEMMLARFPSTMASLVTEVATARVHAMCTPTMEPSEAIRAMETFRATARLVLSVRDHALALPLATNLLKSRMTIAGEIMLVTMAYYQAPILQALATATTSAKHLNLQKRKTTGNRVPFAKQNKTKQTSFVSSRYCIPHIIHFMLTNKQKQISSS
mmetsp:Transcript_10729/g.30673  ORF Transcript_10729/g.30673 Transcript_10729/m.30673 type:complete len:305 (-) Transcript_10729:46-960(-)